MEKELRVIISGGGTGGHIFPAVSIANAVKALRPDAKILFVGALGFDRKNLLKNIKVLYKIWKSQRMAKQIIKDFKPQVAVGVGGYASGPTLNKAAAMGIPCLIQEQNSYAGVTNKLLAKKAAKICVAYEGMERFFPAEKIILTGNPVRQALLETTITREEAIKTFGFNPAKKTILLVGGRWQFGGTHHQRERVAAPRPNKGYGCPVYLADRKVLQCRDSQETRRTKHPQPCGY